MGKTKASTTSKKSDLNKIQLKLKYFDRFHQFQMITKKLIARNHLNRKEVRTIERQ